MRFDLPDLELKPWPEWEAQRQKWIALAEACLYGHAPERPKIRTEVLERTLLWDGRGTKETVRIEAGKQIKVVERYTKYSPPDTGAIHLLLKNLDPEWRNDDRETMDLKQRKLELERQKAEAEDW